MVPFLTQATIWIAMLAWTIAILRREHSWSGVGLVFYILHIFAAYEFHYQWSHAVALSETARQTAEVTGWESGVGLYFNYALAAILASDLAFQYIRGKRPLPRIVDGLVFFMIFNGAVVFGNGAVRLYGAILCGVIAAAWILKARENFSPRPSRPR